MPDQNPTPPPTKPDITLLIFDSLV
jgi:hypothetical protein